MAHKKKEGCIMKKVVKIIYVIMILMMINPITNAGFKITNADLKNSGDCGQLIMYNGSIVKTTYITYTNEGKTYPAYCLERTKPGAEVQEYTVSVGGLITDTELWRILINGYPYKTLSELGVQTVYEAFTATKQAVYYKLENRSIENYAAIPGNEASLRTYNAFLKIVQDANSSMQIKQTPDIKVNKENASFEIDNINKKCMSMTFNVTANGTIDTYNVSLTGALPENTDITDISNNSKATFNTGEKFKILIPIENMTKDGMLNINVTGNVNTKPIFYGTSPNDGYQDYALTGFMLEDGTGMITNSYYKNITKIIILKQDKESKEAIANTEFQILDENKNILKESVLTNEDGEIILENIVPGKYYLRETNPAKGYNGFPELIDLEVGLNETLIVEVNNSLSEKVQVTRNLQVENIERQTNIVETSIIETNVKLPKTGM